MMRVFCGIFIIAELNFRQSGLSIKFRESDKEATVLHNVFICLLVFFH